VLLVSCFAAAASTPARATASTSICRRGGSRAPPSSRGSSTAPRSDREYGVRLPGHEDLRIDGSRGDGPVKLRIEHRDVSARFVGGPARVDWTDTFSNPGSEPERLEGTFAPAYDAHGCRQAHETVPDH
jgi:hypothetical protein